MYLILKILCIALKTPTKLVQGKRKRKFIYSFPNHNPIFPPLQSHTRRIHYKKRIKSWYKLQSIWHKLSYRKQDSTLSNHNISQKKQKNWSKIAAKYQHYLEKLCKGIEGIKIIHNINELTQTYNNHDIELQKPRLFSH